MKKLLVSIFILSLVAMPSATHAGFFDFFKINQKAQVTSAVKSDNLVLQLQQSLTTLGLYSGKVDGVVGFRTTTAIKAFQRQNKLPVTGLLDRTTVDMILKNGGGSRDGGFFGVYDETPPSLSMLDYRCENSVPAFVRILSPWQGNSFVYEEDDVNIQVFVCDNTGVGNTHSLAIVSQGIDIDNNSAIEGTLELVGVFGDSYMTPYGQHSWLMNIPLGSDHFEPGHYSLLTSNEGSYRINNVPQFGLNVYAGWTRPFEVTGEIVSNCDENQVVVSIAGDTPAGVQNINQFNVLKFTVENDSNCDVLLEDLKVAYMTTDEKPYFDEIQIRDEQNNFLGENDELQTDPNFHLGERIGISFSTPLQINSGDSKDLILRLVNYNQPVFDNTVAYNSYKHKYLLFGFINEDDFDFKWTTPQSLSFGGTLDPYNNGWGKMVRIPVTSLQP
jgi:peptidoglycan hydrolase-like protein with peptidoglycan-binding domain